MKPIHEVPVPTFETERLILRPIRLEDAPRYQELFNDYRVTRHLSSGVPWPYPDDGAKFYIGKVILPEQGRGRWMWAITLKPSLELIGAVELWHHEKARDPNEPANRAFWLGYDFWGKGYMTEAVTAVMDFAFDEAGFEILTFSNAVGNAGSHKIKEKTRARFIRNEPAQYVDPIYTHREVWELTKAEWQCRSS